MGDMADFALDGAFDEEEHYYKYEFASPSIQYEEGLIDELGYSIEYPSYSSKLYKKQTSNKNICPKCGSKTTIKIGVNGMFYGCSKFPACNGNNNY